MRYLIVKHAADSGWSFYYEQDPKRYPVHISHSAYDSYTGRQVGIKQVYFEEEFELAKEHCKKMNMSNPMGSYAVCELLEE